jgi:hypothetical protein
MKLVLIDEGSLEIITHVFFYGFIFEMQFIAENIHRVSSLNAA